MPKSDIAKARAKSKRSSRPSKYTTATKPTQQPQIVKKNVDEESEGEWTMVTRGGHHGKSCTLPTQPLTTSTTGLELGTDPYAQRFMSERDVNAGAKVMKKGFVESFRQEQKQREEVGETGEGGSGRSKKKLKRRGGDLVVGFYRFEKDQDRKSASSELRRKFEQDKVNLSKFRQSRKFNPY